jgi:short-subunit dehydrogenase
MRPFTGRRALITGAGHGLGRALAERVAAAGASVVVTDREPARLSSTVDALKAAGFAAAGFPLDVTDSGQIRSVRERVRAEGGPVDLLVNNAGVVFGGPFLDVPPEKHSATYRVNVEGLVAVTHAFLPDLLAAPRGDLVNIASAATVIDLPHAATYASSKWAVVGFSDSLRAELRLLGHRHVGVTVVCPSYIDTGMFAGARPPRLTRALTPDRLADRVVRAVAAGREVVYAPPVVRAAAFLRGVLPRRWYRAACRWLGVETSMVEWRGHAPPG